MAHLQTDNELINRAFSNYAVHLVIMPSAKFDPAKSASTFQEVNVK